MGSREGLSLRSWSPGRAVVFRDSHPCRAILSGPHRTGSVNSGSSSPGHRLGARGSPAAGGANWSRQRAGARPGARRPEPAARPKPAATRRRARVLRPAVPPAAGFPWPGAVAKATAADVPAAGPPPVNRTGARRSPDSLCSAAISGPGREAAPLRPEGPSFRRPLGWCGDRVRWREGARPLTGGQELGQAVLPSCLTAAGRRRRLIGASLAVWSPAAAAAQF